MLYDLWIGGKVVSLWYQIAARVMGDRKAGKVSCDAFTSLYQLIALDLESRLASRNSEIGAPQVGLLSLWSRKRENCVLYPYHPSVLNVY